MPFDPVGSRFLARDRLRLGSVSGHLLELRLKPPLRNERRQHGTADDGRLLVSATADADERSSEQRVEIDQAVEYHQ